MRGSIVRRFTLLSVLIALTTLIPLVIFGLYATQVASDHLVRTTLEELKRDVLIDTDKLKRAFDLAQADLPILSQLPMVQELIWARTVQSEAGIEFWMKAVERAFLSFSTNRKVYNQIRYINEDGWEVVRVDYDGTHPPRLIPRAGLQNQRGRDYFSETMKLEPDQVYTSPLDLHREHGQLEVPYRPVIRYATPLFDDTRNRRGIVIISLMVGPLLDALYQEGNAARKEVYIVDVEGFYLLHPDPAKRWGSPRDLNTGERIQLDFPGLASRLLSQQVVSTVMGEQVITSQPVSGRGRGGAVGSAMNEYAVTSQPIALRSSRSGPALVIFERVPTRIALVAVADMRLYLLILLGGMGAVAVVGAVLVGSRLTRPIGALAQAAHRIQQGDLNARVEAGGSHEIAALGDAFNAMTEGLTHARRQIERQLKELTAMNRIGTAVSGTLSLDEVLDQALDATLLCLNVEAGEIFLLDEERAEVVLARHRGLAPEAFREIPRFTLGEGFPGRVALSGDPLMTSDLAKDLRFLRKQVIEAGFSTFASIPLKAAGRVVGTLDVAIRGSRDFVEGDLSLLTTIGATIGMAVANARLYEAQRMTALQLEVRVEERTMELQAANAQLEAASRHKSAFLANMSHELRTPLNAILGFAELLQGPAFGPLSAKQSRYVGHIHNSGRHLLALINDLLDLSKVEAGKLELRPDSFVLHEALTAALTEVSTQADVKGLELQLQVDESLLTITADPIRFKQIVLNLLSNAVKFTPEGGTVTVTAKLVRGAESEVRSAPEHTPHPAPRPSHTGEFVEIAVQDTGIGMKAEDLPKLFQPFTQLDSPFAKPPKGTGLGLALTKRLVELHGGLIAVASDGPNRGSTFTVRLPIPPTPQNA